LAVLKQIRVRSEHQEIVDKFKGKISISNTDNKEMFYATRDSSVKIIFDMLNHMHTLIYKKPHDFRLFDLELFETISKFVTTLELLDLNPLSIVAFLKKQLYAELISR